MSFKYDEIEVLQRKLGVTTAAVVVVTLIAAVAFALLFLMKCDCPKNTRPPTPEGYIRWEKLEKLSPPDEDGLRVIEYDGPWQREGGR